MAANALKKSEDDAAGRRRYADDDPVVPRRRVVNHFESIPLFGSDRWDLSCLSSRPNSSPFIIDFEPLPDRWRLMVKEFMAQRMNEPVRSIRHGKGARSVGPETCSVFLVGIRFAIRFMDGRRIASLPDLTPEDLEDYRTAVCNSGASAAMQAAYLKTLDHFYESREHLSGGGLAFRPFPAESPRQTAGVETADECATDRIPEEVMRRLLVWALTYVDIFSTDIIRAEGARRSDRGPDPTHDPDEAGVRLDAYITRMRLTGASLPGHIWNGEMKISTEILAFRAGVTRAYLSDPAVRARLAQCGLRCEALTLGRASARLPESDAVWHDRFMLGDHDRECRRLQVAAYIVVAYLSGMRDSEVQALRRGCLTEARDERGAVYRYKLNGLAFKGGGGKGVPRTWIVIEPVARAIRVLESLTSNLHRTRREVYLFAKLRHSELSMGLFKDGIVRHLNAFVEHCDTVLCPRLPGTDFLPMPKREEGPWRVLPTQFRRTMAWHIANRPFGVVAGMVQYGHTSIKMFEGYAGSSESGFAAEVARNEFLARIGDVVEMFEDDDMNVRTAGPHAAELQTFFAQKRREIGHFKGEVADAKRVRELLRQKAAELHMGRLVHCFYTPASARCQEHLKPAERTQPLTGLCDPDCDNACWTRRNLPQWAGLRDECSKLLGSNAIPEGQRKLLNGQMKVIRRVIGSIEAASGHKAPDRERQRG